MITFAIGVTLASIFPIMFILEDLGGSGIYDPGTNQPMPKSIWDQLKDWHNARRR